MILYPAIDVLDGRVVRLAKGDFDAVTEYGDNPVAVAELFKLRVRTGCIWSTCLARVTARGDSRIWSAPSPMWG